LLAGVAVSSFAGAAIALVYHFVDDGVLRQIVYWLMGNLAGKRWEHLSVMAPLVAVGSMGLWLHAWDLNLLLGGEDDARALGVPVERTKRWVMVLTALVTGAAVSVAGIIGFVGLIVPHMMRLLVGPDHRWLLPVSGLAGASFLILADLLARTAVSSVELRAGIVTALFGVPFLLYLLAQGPDMARWTGGLRREGCHLAAGARRDGLLDEVNRSMETSTNQEIVRAQGVSHRLQGRPVLHDVTVGIYQGELLGVIGPNGAGKTTLLRVLAGIARPIQGQVLLAGRPLAHLSDRERARQIAFVSQNPGLGFGFTVRDVVHMGRY